MHSLWSNIPLWLPLSAAATVQVFKFLWEWIRNGVRDLRVLGRAGGMPSSHAAMVTSLTTALGYNYGLDSPFFAISAILAIIVMYDARGVRQESGRQAKVLNQILRELFSGQPISEQELIELLGHTSFEVIVGALVGIGYALLFLVWILPSLEGPAT
jgi:acid phosphatase family membrane protein YuiD